MNSRTELILLLISTAAVIVGIITVSTGEATLTTALTLLGGLIGVLFLSYSYYFGNYSEK
jgi:heme/copper-type cytochrome/quinol oxidase subunit 3